ncbi:MAG: ribonuclease R family protein, partial [Alphaproteobacteria bacterium]
LAANDERPKASVVAKAFGIRGIEDRRTFKDLYKQALGRKTSSPDRSIGMPPVTLFRVTKIDNDGVIQATPENWEGRGSPPTVTIIAGGAAARLIVGSRLIARTEDDGQGGWSARPIRILQEQATEPPELAVVETDFRGRLSLRAARPGRERLWSIAGPTPENLAEGALVLAAPQASRPGTRGREHRARILSVHGSAEDPAAFGMAMLASLEVPIEFPAEVTAAAEAAEPPSLDSREDLRDIPLLTIDGADARDFDDAVFAEPDGKGWRVIVAIADVSHYVRPESPLDREAALRGNSTYLPDRAIPMLPEALSNGLCSLKPDEDRACLFVEMVFNATGTRTSARFGRGLMRSHWRLTYEMAASVDDGPTDSQAADAEATVKRLYGAYACLSKGRAARGPLELILPERVVKFDADGKAVEMGKRIGLSSHRLIEEFMVQANAAAAEALLAKSANALYRVHDKPDPERMGLLAETAQLLGAAAPGARLDSPQRLNDLLARVDDETTRTILSQLVLRAQSRARYGPECDPHFGLALDSYAHFTSPIRRYADLAVHRALIEALSLGDDGEVQSIDALEGVAESINSTERRSAQVE